MTFLKTHPLASALIAAFWATIGLIVLDFGTGPRLEVAAISAAAVPVLDGDISDEAWQAARPVQVLTRHGGDFGGSGESTVTVRAVHDDQFVYMALEWDDPTRSLEYMPLFKDDHGWHVLQENGSTANDQRFFDDRIAIMLAPPGMQLIGGAIHLATRPLRGAPAAMTGRGLHYTAPGKLVDLWVWHAALGALTDRVQDDYIGPPLTPTAAQMAGRERYLGGIGEDDPAHPVASRNFASAGGIGADDVRPVQMPDRITTTLDEISAGAESDPAAEGRLWAVRASGSQPWSPGADAALPPGAVIPGVLVDDQAKPGPRDVVARGVWAGGHWVLELRRSLVAGDKDLPFQDGTMLWFAVFDHAQTRHSYHLRPLIVEMQ